MKTDFNNESIWELLKQDPDYQLSSEDLKYLDEQVYEDYIWT